MMFQIKNEPDGYLLEVYTDIFNNVGHHQWVPLMKFYLQGDAFLFRDSYAPQLSEAKIKKIASMYCPRELYGQKSNREWGVVGTTDTNNK